MHLHLFYGIFSRLDDIIVQLDRKLTALPASSMGGKLFFSLAATGRNFNAGHLQCFTATLSLVRFSTGSLTEILRNRPANVPKCCQACHVCVQHHLATRCRRFSRGFLRTSCTKQNKPVPCSSNSLQFDAK